MITHVRSADLHDFEVFYEPTALTERYLAQGGFTKEYADEATEKARVVKVAVTEELIRQDNLRLNKWNKIFLVINALMALGTLALTIFN